MATKQWWIIDIQIAGKLPVYLGKCFATYEEIAKACGPYHSRNGNNGILIWGPKP